MLHVVEELRHLLEMFLYQVHLNTEHLHEPADRGQTSRNRCLPEPLRLHELMPDSVRRCWGVPDEHPDLFWCCRRWCSLRSTSSSDLYFRLYWWSLSSLPFRLFLEQNSLCDGFPLFHLLTERIRFHLSRHLLVFPSLSHSLSLSYSWINSFPLMYGLLW